MAKDPAFLFYDGDAARDVSHMNRLERGCYFDIIQFQRKYHGITELQAKKVLGKDFELCWEAMLLVLSNENGVYFIEWVRDSINKRNTFIQLQKDRINKRWKNQKKIRNNHGSTVVLPVENERNAEHSYASMPTDATTPDVSTMPIKVFTQGMVLNFEDIWSKYPNKDGKKQALKHFQATVKNEKDLDDIRTALDNYLKSERVKKGFIKNGSTWFNNWRDWIDYKDPVSQVAEEDELLRKAGLKNDDTDSFVKRRCLEG